MFKIGDIVRVRHDSFLKISYAFRDLSQRFIVLDITKNRTNEFFAELNSKKILEVTEVNRMDIDIVVAKINGKTGLFNKRKSSMPFRSATDFILCYGKILLIEKKLWK